MQSYPAIELYYGVLTGLAYSIPFSLSPMFISALGGSYNRTRLLCIVVAIAGLSSLLTGMVDSFPLLFTMRMLHAVCFSLTIPIISALVRNIFPQNRRGLANSMLYSASYLGIAISSLSIIMINKVGWRGTYCIMGLFGLFSAIFAKLILKEPNNIIESIKDNEHKEKVKREKQSRLENIKESFTLIMKNKTTRLVMIAGILRHISDCAIASFIPTFFLR